MLLERGSIECALAGLSEPEFASRRYHIAYLCCQATMRDHVLMPAVAVYFRPRSTSHQMAPAIKA